ncbi:MAG: hypothetical protein AB7V16_11425 [Vulcanibacillus sp.]
MANVRIDDDLHEMMKTLSITNKNNPESKVKEEYREAILNHIKKSNDELIANNNSIIPWFNKRTDVLDKHLSSMMGRTGMDVSMILVGLIYLLEHLFEEDKDNIIEVLKKDGARYYTNKFNGDE